jgi:polysaccharide export outer membrane protein
MNSWYRWVFTLPLLLGPFGFLSHAAEPGLTSEQLKMVQQLTPTERAELLRMLQKGKNAVPGVSTNQPDQEEATAPPEQSEPSQNSEPSKIPEVPRIKVGDTVLIKFHREPPPKEAAPLLLGAPEKKEKIPEQQVFVVDRFGAVAFEGAGQIVLQGLSEPEAAERLKAEPSFRDLDITVKLLPIEPVLKPFGYDIFKPGARRFTPATDIPVPADYVIGPGDVVSVQLYGKESSTYELVVSRDGDIPFPGIGPVRVAGLKFAQMEREIERRVQKQLIGIKASVTLGKLRSIRVFVLGEVEKPGSYAVGGLATMTNALLAGGGVKRIGSLRDIQLKRDGKLISRMDLYDLLLRGDNSGDSRLLPGDVIFIPPIGKTVSIAGSVRRPAIYELKHEHALAELIALAGGLTADAYPQSVQIERIRANRERTLLDLDITQPDMAQSELQDGDAITVKSVLAREEDIVTLIGHVVRPGKYAWRPNMRLTTLIPSVRELLPQSDSGYALIRRERADDRSIELLSANLAEAMVKPGGEADLLLQPRDRVYVFGAAEDRSVTILPLLQEARARSAPDRPIREVSIGGSVHHPGRYPLGPDMRVNDLIAAAGGLNDEAYVLDGELTRFEVVEGKAREYSREQVNIGAALRGDAAKNLVLRPHDSLVVRRVPGWDVVGHMEVQGEVRFPGKYPVVRGETLSSVLKRAGGVTDEAYPRGAIFVRESVRAREQVHFEELATQLERDLTVALAEAPGIGEQKNVEVAEGRTLLRQMRAARATGRMVIKLDDILRNDKEFDIEVEDGDRLFVPKRPHEVTVLGEVYHPTAHVYNKELRRDEYVQLSGGVTERGNKSATYVVHADGSVTPPIGWFNNDVDVGPGDTIVVPLKVDRVSSLKVATDVSQIIFQLAVAVAAMNAIGIF